MLCFSLIILKSGYILLEISVHLHISMLVSILFRSFFGDNGKKSLRGFSFIKSVGELECQQHGVSSSALRFSTSQQISKQGL